jgi:DNA-binding response OmpR family regulator
VALIDINWSEMNGVEFITKLRACLLALRTVTLTTYEQSGLIFAALRAGGDGYFLKKSDGALPARSRAAGDVFDRREAKFDDITDRTPSAHEFVARQVPLRYGNYPISGPKAWASFHRHSD